MTNKSKFQFLQNLLDHVKEHNEEGFRQTINSQQLGLKDDDDFSTKIERLLNDVESSIENLQFSIPLSEEVQNFEGDQNGFIQMLKKFRTANVDGMTQPFIDHYFMQLGIE